PARVRGRYQGYLSSIFVAASMFGPVAGGYLTQGFGWRSVFLVNVPLGAVALILARRLPAHRAEGGSLRFDVIGTLLFAAFVTPVILALEKVQRVDPHDIPA
ncbi:MFS transporter, partial [Acidisphaera rubrifaciens]|uniref:MFS transporter n=1 Tax=Acidisphaera rubrifaciens TaxID=50715 RepID=UPI0006622503